MEDQLWTVAQKVALFFLKALFAVVVLMVAGSALVFTYSLVNN